jgi:hypothetical protein
MHNLSQIRNYTHFLTQYFAGIGDDARIIPSLLLLDLMCDVLGAATAVLREPASGIQ